MSTQGTNKEVNQMDDQEEKKEQTGGRLVVDILKSINEIKNSPSKIKEEHLQRAIKSRDYYRKQVIDGTTRAINEKVEEAFFYNSGKEIHRLHAKKEITKEEYENNPLRIAYLGYVGGLPYRAGDLSFYCIIEALSSFKRAPGIKSTTNKAIEIAKGELKHIYSETNANMNIMALYARNLFDSILFYSYILFEYKEWEAVSAELSAIIGESYNVSRELAAAERGTKEETEIRARLISIEEHEEELFEIDNSNQQRALKGVAYIGKSQEFIEEFIKGLFTNADYEDQGEVNPFIPYFKMPNTPALMRTQQVLNNPLRVGAIRTKEITHKKEFKTGNHVINYKSKSEDITWTIRGELQEIVNGVKLFNFFMQKGNEQHWPENGPIFNLQELIDLGIYGNKDSAYYGLLNSVKHMQNIDIEGDILGYEGRKPKKVRNAGGPLILWRDISYNHCQITIAPIFYSGYVPITAITDQNFFRLPKLAHMLLSYIMSCARLPGNAKNIKDNGYFNLSIEAIRLHLGLPTIEEARKNPKYLIIDKIEEAIGNIRDSAGMDGIKIEVITDYDTTKPRPPATDYLNGRLKIFVDDLSRKILTERATEKENEIKKAQKRTEKALQKIADKKVSD